MKTNYVERTAEECDNCKWRRIHAVAMVYYCGHNIDEDEPVYLDERGISIDATCDDFELSYEHGGEV